MKLKSLLWLLFLSLSALGQELSVYDLNCEYLENPMGIGVQNPRLSWKIKASEQGINQQAYSIRVSRSENMTDQLIWESGKIASSASNLVTYVGPDLQSSTRYFWQIKIWDNYQNESDWSAVAFWETGMLNKEEWKALWIEPQQDTFPNGPAIYIRKDFNLSKNIARARVYTTAHGIYELHLNGKKVTEDLFTPGWTSYQHRLQYQTYDITGLVKRGQNVIGAIVGEGWYKGYLGFQNQWGFYGNKVAFFGQILVEYTDGTKEIVVTDNTWKASSDGPIIMNSLYNGETYDARKELSGWDQPGFNDGDWEHVVEAKYGIDNLIASESVPVRKIQELEPVKIWRTPRGTIVADMGQNMVGWVRLMAEGPEGTTIKLRHAEVLDKNGEFYTENLRYAKATTSYTLKGKGIETYEPRFTFMGFRYVAIEGFPGEPGPENLTGMVIHSDMEPSGSFECSNKLINQLQHNIQWGQKGNFLEVPTDCPQRDERLGWTGDAQVFLRTAAFNMNIASFFTKWLKDLAADQDSGGGVPFIIPNIMEGVYPSAGWSDIATIAPWTMYLLYGDINLLEEQYPSMRSYVGYIREKAGEDYIWAGGSLFGDWLFFKPELQYWTVPDAHTDQDLIATAFFAYSTKLLLLAAEELGYTDDVVKYTELLENIKQSFNKNFVTPSGRIISDSQTSYVLALMFDLLPHEQKEKAIEHLVNRIRSRDNHISTGFLGTPYICHVLSDNGYTDVAYDLLLQETYPSWLYPVKMGATTIWERWDGIKPDSTFQNAGMNSFNHYAYGAIGDWMYRVVAGINPDKPGYKHILIRPQPDTRLEYAKASYDSRYGRIKSGWTMKENELKIAVTIPPNTTADIILPHAELSKVKIDDHPLHQVFPDATEVGENVKVEVGSGSYLFIISRDSNYY